MVQNVRRGFNPHGVKKVFSYNLVIMHWTLNSIHMQFEYQYLKSINVSVEHVQLLRGMFGFFELRKMLRSFAERGNILFEISVKRVPPPGGKFNVGDKQETAHLIEGDVNLRFKNHFIYVGVDISIYALLTGTELILPV